MLGVVQAIVVYLLVGLATGVSFASGVGGALVLLVLSILISFAFAFASLAVLLALRFGTGEAVEGIFPLLFVTIFLSSASLPRNLIKATWFRDVATYNPVSYLLEGLRSLVITGWDARALALGFGFALALPMIALGLAQSAMKSRLTRDMRRFVNVAAAVAWRSIHNTLVTPAILVPSIIFPLFFLIAFAGGLSRISDVPNVHYAAGYTSFHFVFVFLQSAAFGGVFTGFAVARDFDSGFARRLPLSAPRRSGIIAGYALGAPGEVGPHREGRHDRGSHRRYERLRQRRAARRPARPGRRDELRGRPLGHRPGDVLRTEQAGAVIQMPVFVLLFLAPVYVPVPPLTGWIHDVASFNPVTPVLEAGRGLLAGSPVKVVIAFAGLVAAAVVLSAFPRRGLASAERSG